MDAERQKVEQSVVELDTLERALVAERNVRKALETDKTALETEKAKVWPLCKREHCWACDGPISRAICSTRCAPAGARDQELDPQGGGACRRLAADVRLSKDRPQERL